MAKKLELKFDPNQQYQLDAVASVVDLFDRLPHYGTEFTLGDEIVANLPAHETLSEPWLYDNLVAVVERFNEEREDFQQLSIPMHLEVDDGLVIKYAGNESWRYPSFTIEMETGTGKTYVFLRTMYELRRRYGFSKFVVIVPSIAIYEGFIKNFAITRDHFRALYGNETVNLIEYDGSQLSRLRSFATSPFLDVMVITIDSFNKHYNRIWRASEQLPGETLPYEYIQKTRPIVIIDEPQSSVSTEKAKSAVRALHPLFALRYSATHRESPNLVYRLTPFDAYQQNLVKKIQVVGITKRNVTSKPFVALQSVQRGTPITAEVRTTRLDGGAAKEADIVLRHGDDLSAKTGREDQDGAGYVVTEISAVPGNEFVEFENGERLYAGTTIAPSKEDIFRQQIRETIQRHMEEQERLKDRGIKVLSLFFIDRVANYVDEDGIIKTLFDQLFEQEKHRFPFFQGLSAEDVREGYFAKQRNKKTGEEEAIDTTGRTKDEREAEKEAFELIMKKKEQLLSFDEDVAFVFAHSALKEGWDNPNVFQICTLNQTVSEIKKRQEIGRGLRLCVSQKGERVFDEDINVLTVVANESYEKYASDLQKEYRKDGVAAPPKPTNAARKAARRNPAIFEHDAFEAFCQKLFQKSSYTIHVDTDALVEACIDRLNREPFPDTVLVVEKGDFVVYRFTLRLESVTSGGHARIAVSIVSSDDTTRSGTSKFSVGDKLDKKLKEERLRGFQIVEIEGTGSDAYVKFGNDEVLRKGQTLVFESEAGQRPETRTRVATEHTYPVFNLLDRAAKELELTRPTLNRIFRGLSADKKEHLFKNPEGFAGTFISVIRNVLADHIAERITFSVTDSQMDYDLETLFPEAKQYAQKELIEAGPRGLYDHVQIDSEKEQRFVRHRLREDEDQLVLYFKFPPSFKVPLPKLIGNYNPDWGIVRRSENGETLLELVRETKGSPRLEDLQFPHEKRKILCARKHFEAIDVDYRFIDPDQTVRYWQPAPHSPLQSELPIPGTKATSE